MELSGDGKVVKAKFIEGGKDKIKLDAPKGLGLLNGVLYVSNVTVVRKFDVKTGAPKGEIAIKDSTFLNDLAIAADGRIFVTDSGDQARRDGFRSDGQRRRVRHRQGRHGEGDCQVQGSKRTERRARRR